MRRASSQMEPNLTRFVNLNGIPTKIILFDDNINAKDINNNNDNSSDDLLLKKFNYERLILMIPGNPGEIESYRQLLWKIHKETKIPVMGISQTGHNRIPNNLPRREITGNSYELCGLNAQIEHKVQFIRNYLSADTRILIIAHSIGCYMTLELLDRFKDIRQRIDHSICIFPVIDSVVDTPPGQFFKFLLTYFYYIILVFTYLFDFPLFVPIQVYLMQSLFQKTLSSRCRVPDLVIESARNLLNPYCFKATYLMVMETFRTVKKPKYEIIKTNANNLSMFYGEKDHWAPIRFYYSLKDKLTNCLDRLDLRLCLGIIDHAFVSDPEATDKISLLSIEVINKKWNL